MALPELLTSTEFMAIVMNANPPLKRNTYRHENDTITEFLDRNGVVYLKRIINDCGYTEFWRY